MSVAEDWALEAARLIAERYVMRDEVEVETQMVLAIIEAHCPFSRGVTYQEVPSKESE